MTNTAHAGPANVSAELRSELALASEAHGSRSLRDRRTRMNVATDPNGIVTLTPDAGHSLLVLGNPAEGLVEVVEIMPPEPVQPEPVE